MPVFKAGNDCRRGFRSRLPKSLEDSRCGSVRKDWRFYSFKTLKGSGGCRMPLIPVLEAEVGRALS